MAAKPTATGTLSINEGSGPFHYGDTLTFTYEASHLQGGYPMVAVYLFQDANADGVVDEENMYAGDLVWLTLNHPEEAVLVGGGSSALDSTLPAKGRAALYRYAWKGGKESIDELARVEFDAGP